MSHFRDRGANSHYGPAELQVVISDTAGFLSFRWSHWQVHPATRATYRRYQEAARVAAFVPWSISSAITTSRGDVLWRTSGGGGRQINRQLIQVYRRYQTAALSIQQAPNICRRGWDPQRMPSDFTLTGLTASSEWFSQILWLNNSVIHILSALKAPIPSFKSLPFGQGTLFLPHGSTLPFLLLSVVHQTPHPCQLSPSSLPCTSARSEFSFLPSGALIGPRPL